MCLSAGQGIQSHGETERNRQTEAAPVTSGPACQVLQSHSLGESLLFPWAGTMIGMEEREDTPTDWAKAGTLLWKRMV